MLQPTVDELARRGTPFVGLLYAGLALTGRGVRVIEFNARFGDPETQPLLARLITPLGGLLYAAATGSLADQPELEWADDAAVAVVLAAENYPGDAGDRRGDRPAWSPLPRPEPWWCTPGTALDAEGRLVSSGGRVLCVVGHGRGSRPGPRARRTRGSAGLSCPAPSTAPTSPPRRARPRPRA